MARKMIGISESVQPLLERARLLSGKGQMETVVEALGLFVQLAEEWDQGNRVFITNAKDDSVSRILEPACLLTKRLADDEKRHEETMKSLGARTEGRW